MTSRTGEPWDHIWVAPWLRNATEDMTTLMHAYQREQALGRAHPEWLAWVKSYSDWLVEQQRPDGSFPRRWKPGTNEVMEPTGTGSYNVVPLFVLMTQITGDQKYQAAAIRAAEYVWSTWGTRGLFIGGASDNPNITDKEAGMLSLEGLPAPLRRHERSQMAGARQSRRQLRRELDLDLEPAHACRRRQRASCTGRRACPPSVCRTSPRRTPAVRTSIWTGQCRLMPASIRTPQIPHYLAVARVLLMDTKSMVALPGRQYDMRGIGWQQENFRLGPGPNGRGVGSHRHLAAVGLRQSPARNRRPGRLRPGPVQATVCKTGCEECPRGVATFTRMYIH